MKPIVYFTKEISPEALIKLYDAVGKKLTGNIAIKLHSGEDGNQNYVRPEFVKPVIDYVKGTVCECNTAYDGARNSTAKHLELLKKHGWAKYFDVCLMDRDSYFEVPIPNGKIIKKNYLGEEIKKFDSLLVLSHFKGHPMGGFGGALKQLSIGCASTEGKAYIHSEGHTIDQNKCWDDGIIATQDHFLEAMADAASSVCERFKDKMVFINMMVNLSVDCDCCAVAEDPCMKDIGMLASVDPIALDQACIDKIWASSDRGRDHFIERVERQNGRLILKASEDLGFGSREYELVCID